MENNNITKTIMDNNKKFEEVFPCILDAYDNIINEDIKSHLLQSQIRLIETILQMADYETMDFPTSDYEQGYLDGFDKVISSLNETLEELRRSV